jgi:DNA-binding FadR family transcriptional regulator
MMEMAACENKENPTCIKNGEVCPWKLDRNKWVGKHKDLQDRLSEIRLNLEHAVCHLKLENIQERDMAHLAEIVDKCLKIIGKK